MPALRGEREARMSQATAIEWTDLSWNPVHGCSIVSTECRNCYAQTLSLRYGQTKKPWTPANAAENVILKPHKLREPLSNAKHWRGLGAAAAAAGKTDGKLVFVNSTSDLFHEQIPDEYIARVWSVMANAPRHVFQVLTKRPERMRTFVRRLMWASPLETGAGWSAGLAPDDHWSMEDEPVSPLQNVWLGVSIGLRHFVRRADLLRDTPAAVRFISAEPLLGPLVPKVEGNEEHCVAWWPDGNDTPCVPYDGLDLTDIDWLIMGGESGPGHRPLDLEWMRDLREHCEVVDVACFVKQLGGARPGTSLTDLPEGLRIREFPRVAAVQAAREAGRG